MTQAQGNRIQLGQKVRDPLSGLVGQVVTISDWLYGCTRIGIQPDGNKDGKPFDIFYIDEPQVEIVEETKLAPAPPRHGPRPDEGRRAEGSR